MSNLHNLEHQYPENIPPMFDDIRPEYLMSGIASPDDPAMRKRLMLLIYGRYGHRRIGCMMPLQFKRWFVQRWLSLWYGKYDKLYASVNLILDPFVSVIVNTKDNTQEIKRNRVYGEFRNVAFGNSVSAGNTTEMGSTSGSSASEGNNEGRNQGAGTSSEAGAEGGQSFAQGAENELFSDTPQSPIDNSVSEGTDKGDAGGWNEGYTTTMNQTKNTKYNKDNRYTGHDAFTQTDNKTQSIDNRQEASQSKSYGAGSNQAKTATQDTGHSTTSQNTGTLHKGELARLRKGLEGFLVSEALTQYRNTCIAYDDMFADEFGDLFFGVLNNGY